MDVVFAGIALIGWGWIVLDAAYERDMGVLGVLGAFMIGSGIPIAVFGLLHFIVTHVRIV